MQNLFISIKKIIDEIENLPTNFYFWILSFFSIIIIRLLTEIFLFDFSIKTKNFLFYEFTHTFLFFLISFLCFLFLISKLLKTNLKKTSNILLFGFISIIIPPIIDFIISNGKGFWSFYKFDSLFGLLKRFFTFFGNNPQIGITYGVRVEIILMLFLLFVLSYIKTRKIIYSCFFTFLSYLTFFILGTFPSYITLAIKAFQKNIFKINDLDIAQTFLSSANLFSTQTSSIESSLNIKMSLIYGLLAIGLILVGSFIYCRKKFLSFVKNIRLTQIAYHLGLFGIGLKLAMFFSKTVIDWNFFNIMALLNILTSIILAWITSIVVNDIFDKNIDSITNKSRPLVNNIFTKNEYFSIGIVSFFFSILLSSVISLRVALLLIAYQALAWVYSAPPLRLKKFILFSSFISAVASTLIFVSGYVLISPSQDISQLPTKIIWLLLISLTLSLPIKDLKDFSGDKKNHIQTIPVVFGKYWGKIIIASGIFFSYILSIIFLNEYKLLPIALVTGIISFWIINLPKETKIINSKNLIVWLLMFLFIYLMFAYYLLF